MATPSADRDSILATLLTGKSQTQTAALHGVTRSTVERVVRHHRADHPILSAKKPNRVPPPGSIPIPSWVRRADLVSDYADVARLSDEFDAARHCRRLLEESRA
ncbi:helix-turn-helix domain-containing protein [Methylobacterium sp. Leaf118]|uniref:helix-turn-helix domain-containing protein n=1 Tax=Methylobacterium sp. Leaf118 TaxID=2876562 RepID=UPI001E5A42D2|nr:helix-turn-helix domain-containing protein [Methylobacterium sp. Leaf118]